MSKVFKTIDPKHITIRSFKAYKTFRHYYDGVDSGSLSVLEGVKPNSKSEPSSSRSPDKHFSPKGIQSYVANGTIIISEPKNTTGAYKRSVYHLVDKLYYKYHKEPLHSFTTRDIFSASFQAFENNFPTNDGDQITLIGIPQIKTGDEIKPGSVRIGTSSGSISGEFFSDDSMGNLYSETLSSSFASKPSASYFPTESVLTYYNFNTSASKVYNQVLEKESASFYRNVVENNDYLTITDGATFVTGANATLNYLDKSLSLASASQQQAVLSSTITLDLGQDNTISGSAISWWMKRNSLDSGNTNKYMRVFWGGTTARKFIDSGINGSGNFILECETNVNEHYMMGASQDSGVTADLEWHHNVLNVSGGLASWYLDGNLVGHKDMEAVGTSGASESRSLDITSIGRGQSSNQAYGDWYDGLIDEVRFYTSSLSEHQVKALHQFPDAVTTTNVGNIFYRHGNVVVTQQNQYKNLAIGSGSYKDNEGDGFYIRHQSTHQIYENEFICQAKMGEMNATMNPSIILPGTDNTIAIGEVSHSLFAPYVTTVGLYSDNYELLAIGKLARPIKKSNQHDTSFVVRLDF